MFFRTRECSQSFRRRSSVMVLRMSISLLSWASVWTWVTHRLLVSSVMLLIWIWTILMSQQLKDLLTVWPCLKCFRLTAANLHVVYLQPVKANVTAEGVIDSSHCPIHLIQALSESAQLPRGLPGRDGVYWLRQLHFPNWGVPGVVDVHLSWTSWLWSQVEVRDTSEIKLDTFLSAELLREDSRSSSCSRYPSEWWECAWRVLSSNSRPCGRRQKQTSPFLSHDVKLWIWTPLITECYYLHQVDYVTVGICLTNN